LPALQGTPCIATALRAAAQSRGPTRCAAA